MQISSNTSGIQYSPMSNNGLNQDNILKSIQKQIENVHKQLQNLAENNKMPIKEKMEKQKELQQQIQELNQKMTQRNIEIQQEKQEKLKEAVTAVIKQEFIPPNQSYEPTAIKAPVMQELLITAKTSMAEAKTLQSVKTKLEGEAKILANEINSDITRGVLTEGKGARRDKLNESIDNIAKDIMDKMADINTILREARNIDEKTGVEQLNESQKEEKIIPGNDKEPEANQSKLMETALQVQGENHKGKYVNIKM